MRYICEVICEVDWSPDLVSCSSSSRRRMYAYCSSSSQCDEYPCNWVVYGGIRVVVVVVLAVVYGVIRVVVVVVE